MKPRSQLKDRTLDAVLKATVDGILVIDTKGTIQLVNPAAERIFGYAAKELLGNNVSVLMPEPDRSGHDAYIDSYLTTGRAKIIGIGRQVEGRRKDGTVFPVDLAVGEIDDREKLFVGIIRDISQRQSLERQMARLQRMEALGQLTGGVAHDFNNLLAIIQGNVEFLEDQTELTQTAREALEDCKEAVDLGAQLTGRLLAFARRQPLEPVSVDLSNLVFSMSELLQRSLGESIAINLNIDRSLWRARVDPGEVETALLNLAINARDAMDGKGTLTLSLSNRSLGPAYTVQHPGAAAGDYVAINVADTGHGIPEEILDHVFEPFFTTKESGAGTGLGLSMVYGFVKQSGGHIELKSEPGAGTELTLLLPRSTIEDPSSRPADDNTQPETPGGRILVVEDNDSLRDLTAKRLAQLGYVVHEAASGREALGLFDQEPEFDLLLSDIMMPDGIDGVELAGRFNERWPNAAILLMSGYADALAGRDGAVELGIEVLKKPFTKATLAKRVAARLSRRSGRPGR